MQHHSIRNTTIAAAILLTLGCQESHEEEAKLVERMAAEAPTLTSNTPSPLPRQIEQAEEKESNVAELTETTPQPFETEPSFEPVVQSFDGMTIQRLITTSAIEDREPIVASSVFGNGDDKIYAFIEASNASESERAVLVHFIGPGGEVSGGIELRIPALAPRWRTWAYTRHAKAPGIWRVEIRIPSGALLGALPFEVEPDC